MKILPYPRGQPVAEYLDAVHDIATIGSGTAGQSVDTVVTSEAELFEGNVSGRTMTSYLSHYNFNPTPTNYKRLRLPFSAPIPCPCSSSGLGIGRVDTARLVPNRFYAQEEGFIPSETGWRSALVPSPSFTPIHNDHWLSGQIMAHMFGKKVRVAFQSFLNTLFSLTIFDVSGLVVVSSG